MKAYLILGCNGFLDKNNMLYCNSISNPIIDLENLNELEKNNVISFLDNACNIFEKPCVDYNMVGNTINLLHKKFYVIDEKLIPSIQSFLRMHKTCGIYLMLVLKEDYDARR